MKNKLTMIAASAVASLVASGVDAATMLKCTFQIEQTDGGWLRSPVYVQREGKAKSILVVDSNIKDINGDWLDGRVSIENSVRTTYVWDLRAGDPDGTDYTVKYQLTVQKSNKSARITAEFLGFENFYDAEGACKSG